MINPFVDRNFFRQTKIYYLLMFLFALLFLWPLVLHPNHIPMAGTLQTTDFISSHLSYAQYIHNSWLKYGRLPLWNSSMLSGMPLISDPLSGYFYLPNWLTFIFPVPLSFNILFVFHLFWTGIGLFLFLQSKCKIPLSALLGSLAWMGTPKLIGYLGSGQVSSVFALTWFPWLLYTAEKFSKTLKFRYAVMMAGVLAIIVLIDIRWGYLAGLLLVSYLFSILVKRELNFGKMIVYLVIFLCLIIVLTAVLLLPLSELMIQTDRADLTVVERANFSLNWVNMVGVITPQAGIIAEFITYIGIAVLIFAIFGLSKENWYWILLILFSVLISMGTKFPLFAIFSKYVPGFNWLRVPSRFWFFVSFGMAILAAYGFDRLLRDPNSIKQKFRTDLVAAIVSLFAIFLAIGISIYFPPLPKGILIFSVMVPLTMILINLFLYFSNQVWIYFLFIVFIFDLLWFNSSVFQGIPLQSKSAIVVWLESQPGLFRVFSPSSDLLPPHSLQTVEGVNPTHLKNYARYVSDASKISQKGYSVTVPGIYLDENSPLELYEAASSPDLHLFGLLNIRYVVTNFPINNMGTVDQMFKEKYVYFNPEYKERVWLEGPGSVELTYWSPDVLEVEVKTDEETLLIVSEIDYPGWEATLNGDVIPIETIYGLFRSLHLPAGTHKIVLKYNPVSFYTGLVISTFGWMLLIILFGSWYVKPFMAQIRSTFS